MNTLELDRSRCAARDCELRRSHIPIDHRQVATYCLEMTCPGQPPSTVPTESDDHFDGVLSRLRTLVDKLEQGNLTLEESLRTFEAGVTLARRGHALLDAAEKRVDILVRGSGDGDGEEPFPSP